MIPQSCGLGRLSAFFLALELALVYAAADAVGGAALILASVDCNSKGAKARETGQEAEPCARGDFYNAAIYMWAASRITQVVDSVMWSYSYYRNHQAKVLVLPTNEGLSLNYAINF